MEDLKREVERTLNGMEVALRVAEEHNRGDRAVRLRDAGRRYTDVLMALARDVAGELGVTPIEAAEWGDVVMRHPGYTYCKGRGETEEPILARHTYGTPEAAAEGFFRWVQAQMRMKS